MQVSRQDIGEYLIRRLYDVGVRHVFGVPGDYILNFYARLEKSMLQVINTSDEQGAGFAADAYGRVHGLGVVCVTYNVGGLKVLNAAAGAYAEQSPLLVIAGAPGWQEREQSPLLHHKIREYDDQLTLFRHLTVAATALHDPTIACQEIDRVISAVITQKRPGYIELPRDMVSLMPQSAPVAEEKAPGVETSPALLEEIVSTLNSAERPVILAGSGITRSGLGPVLRGLAEKANIPIVSTILGKSAIDERNPHYLGVYAGIVGDEAIRTYLESSDCLLLLGVLLSDVDQGANTAVLPDTLIILDDDCCSIGGKSFPVPGLMVLPDLEERELKVHDMQGVPLPVRERMPPFVPSDAPITMESVILALNAVIDEQTVLIAEVGDAVMSALDVTVKRPGGFMSPAYYSSLGFSVPASIGVQAANPDLRPIVLSGDGAFQMTGLELSTAARYHMNPIVVLLNNGGFGTERPMIDGVFNDIAPWAYHRIPEVFGCGKGFLIHTTNELADALKEAYASKEFTILEVILDPHDISPQLRRLCQRFSHEVRSE